MFHDRHLLHRRLGRVLIGAALTVALSMAFPGGAHAAGPTGSTGVWRWLEDLFADRIGAVTGDRTPPRRAIRAKDLVCPPTGCPTTPGTNQGSGTDPDGRPH
jgi:hypothetical protein